MSACVSEVGEINHGERLISSIDIYWIQDSPIFLIILFERAMIQTFQIAAEGNQTLSKGSDYIAQIIYEYPGTIGES